MRKREEKRKKKLKVISYWLLVISFLVLVGCGLRLVRMSKEAVWDGKGRASFVVADREVSLVSLEPENKNLVILKISKDTEIETTRGYGRYRIGAVYQLGELEGKGGSLLRESVQEYFGIPVDGWIKTWDMGHAIWDTKKDLLKIFSGLILGRKGETNFTLWDVLRLWWEMRKILPHQTKLILLDEIGALKSKVLVDGSRAWEVNRERLDIFLQDNFYEPKIREENLTIRVINTTDYPGLANHAARIVGNMGGRVVGVSSEDGKREASLPAQAGKVQSSKCEIRSEKKKRETFTVQKLVKALNCQFVEEEGSDERAEVTVLVGENYWRMLNEK